MTSPSPLATDENTDVSMDQHIYNFPATRFILPPPIDTTTTFSCSQSSSSGIGRPLSSNKLESTGPDTPAEDETILVMVKQAKKRLAKVKGLLSRLRKKANRTSSVKDSGTSTVVDSTVSTAPQTEETKNLMSVLAADSSLYENLTQSLAKAVAANNHPNSLTHDSASDLLESVKDAISALQIQDEDIGFIPPAVAGSCNLYVRETDLDDFEDAPRDNRRLVKAVHPVSEQSVPPIPAKPSRMKNLMSNIGTPSSTLDTSVTKPTLPRDRTKLLTFRDHINQPLYHHIGDGNTKQPQVNEDRFIDSESAFLSFFDHPLDETLQRLSGESGYSHLKRMTEERGNRGGEIYDDKVHRFMEAVRRENSSQLLKRNVYFANPNHRANRFQGIPEETQDTVDDMESFSTLRTDTTMSLAPQPPPPPSLASKNLARGRVPPPIPPKSQQVFFSNPFQVFFLLV